jgi:hypothetical protein
MLRRISIVSWVVDYDLSVIGFLFLSLGFIWEIFAVHSDEISPAGVGRCTLLFILDCILFCIIIIIILFIQYLIYFIHLVFRTHVSLCVHDGINHPYSILIILGYDKYSVGSHLFLICQFTGNYLLLTIWRLKTYYIHLLLFCKLNYHIRQTRVRAL